MTDDEVMLGARIDETLKQLVDADPRKNQEIVARALWNEFGGERKGAIETRITHKENRIKEVKSEIEDLQEELAELQSEKEVLEDKLEDLGDREQAYFDRLDRILDNYQSGERTKRIVPSELEGLSRDYAKEASQIHEDIKQRAVDQERQMSTKAFVAPMNEANIEIGPVTEVWGESDE